jgi:predicted nucleic acid-binding protein
LATELLFDTDVFVDHIRGTRRLPDIDAAYSLVTRCELFAGREREEEAVRALLTPLHEIPIDRAIAERAGRLRRGSPMLTPDALIAATAIEHGLALVTRNRRDFKDVPGLQLRDPTSLSP